MSPTWRLAGRIFVMAIAAGVVAQTPGAGPNIPRVQLSEAETTAKIIYRVPPIYPTQARAAHIEGTAVFSAIVGKDGSIVSMQTISGHPLLTRAALEVVPKWRYQPTLRDGEPVEVATTITVTFKLSDQPQPKVNRVISPSSALPESAVDSDTTSPETIYLKNGRIIHADSASEAGNKLEYTIGESIYEIPDSLVRQIAHSENAPPSPSHATTLSNRTVVSAPALNKMPIAYGDDPKNWYMYESTQQLRDECQSGQFSSRLHPEFESRSNFPGSAQEAQMACAGLAVNMESAYEELVDRGVELQRILCTDGKGQISGVRSSDPTLAADQDELGRISAEFIKRMAEVAHQEPVDRAKVLRTMLDFGRIAGTCGHGM